MRSHGLIVSFFSIVLLAGITCGQVTVFDSEDLFLSVCQPEQVIDFETYGDGTVPTGSMPILSGNEWWNLGVSFSPENPESLITLERDHDQYTPHSLYYALVVQGIGMANSSVIMNFQQPVRCVGAWICDNEYTSPEEVIILYDCAGTVLGIFPLPYYGQNCPGPEGNYFRGFVSDVPIAMVLLREAPDNEWMYVDDVMFTPCCGDEDEDEDED